MLKKFHTTHEYLFLDFSLVPSNNFGLLSLELLRPQTSIVRTIVKYTFILCAFGIVDVHVLFYMHPTLGKREYNTPNLLEASNVFLIYISRIFQKSIVFLDTQTAHAVLLRIIL
jgi:hypothetical protein